jgi:hypothetical protein
MQSYPVDLDPEQVVRWVMAERRAAPSTFTAIAKRTVEPRDLPGRRELRLGDQEREELSEIATVATLEVSPAHTGDGWRLMVIVEDEVGPRIPEEGVVDEGDEEIDLDTFYDEFIRPGRRSANVVAEADDASAERRLAALLSTIERNRHGSERGSSGRGPHRP